MKPAFIEKLSRKKGKLMHVPISELPKLAHEDVSLHSWKRKAAKIANLDQELGLINQKIGQVQSILPEYAPPQKAILEAEIFPPKSTTERSPTIIEVSHDYATVTPQVSAVNDLLAQVEQATLENGNILRVCPLPEKSEEKEDIDLHYHPDNMLLLRLQSAIIELNKKWIETQQRLQTIKSAPPEVKESLSRIDEELSQMRAFAGTQKGKIITVPPPQQKLKPSWKKRWQRQKLELKAQQKAQKMLDEISSEQRPYQEKLEAIDDQLSSLKRTPPQQGKMITVAPETGHSFTSPQLKKKARQEVQKIIQTIDTDSKKNELSAIDKELEKLEQAETQSRKIVLTTPTAIHYFPLSKKAKKKAQQEVQKIMKTIHQEQKQEELSAIDEELSALESSSPQTGKIIISAAAEGHHIIAPEIKKKAKQEIEKLMQDIEQSQKPDSALSTIDAELSELDIPVAEGKIITIIKPLKEKSGLKKKFGKIKEKIAAITNHQQKEAAAKSNSTKQTLSKNKHHSKSRQVRTEELANVDRMLQKITQELAEEES